jgi:hypothetical protein
VKRKFPLVWLVTFERKGVTYRGLCEGVTPLGFYVTRVQGVGLLFVAPSEQRYEP